MRLTSKLAGLALASILLGACATSPEVTALSEQGYSVSDYEQADQPRQPDMEQATRRALRQAAQVARRNDADYLRVRDIRIFETTKKVPILQRQTPPIASAGLIGFLVGEVINAAATAAIILPPGAPTQTLKVWQVYLDFEISAEDQGPAAGGDYLMVRRVLEITAPFDNDEEQISDELPPQVRTLLDKALLHVQVVVPAPDPPDAPLVIPARAPDGTVIEEVPATEAPPTKVPATEASVSEPAAN